MERLAHSAFAQVRNSGIGPGRMREPQYNSVRNGERVPPHLWRVYRAKTYKDDNEFLCFSGETKPFEEWMRSFAFIPESVYIAYPPAGVRLTLIQFLNVFEPVLHIRTGERPMPPKVEDFSKLGRTDAEKALQMDLNGLVVRANAAFAKVGETSGFVAKRMRFGAPGGDMGDMDADHEPPLPDTVPAQIREERDERERDNTAVDQIDFDPPRALGTADAEQAVARVVDARLRPYVDLFYAALERVLEEYNARAALALVERDVQRKIEMNKEVEKLNSVVQRVRDVIGFTKNEIRRRYVTLMLDRLRRAASSEIKRTEEENRYRRALEVFEARTRDKRALTRAVGAVVRAHMRVGEVDDPPAPDPAPPPVVRPLAPPPAHLYPTRLLPVQPFVRATGEVVDPNSDSDSDSDSDSNKENEDGNSTSSSGDEDTSGDDDTSGDEDSDDDKENVSGNVSMLETPHPTAAPSLSEAVESSTRTLIDDDEAMFMPNMPRRTGI